MTEIGERMFYNCSDLQSITIPEGVKEIGDFAFFDCSNLQLITIPKGVMGIGNFAFCNCSNLKDIYCQVVIPPAIEAETFFDCYGTILHVPAGSKVAYESAYYWSMYFTNIVEEQPVGLNAIDADSAIRYADGMLYLKDADIPAAITVYTIAGKCIRSCKAVTGACDLSMLPNGVYIVRICIDGKVTNIKIRK